MTTQNSLMEELVRHGKNFYKEIVQSHQGFAPSPEQSFCIDMQMYGAAYAVRDWLLNGCKEDTTEVAEYIVAFLPPSIRPFFENTCPDEK